MIICLSWTYSLICSNYYRIIGWLFEGRALSGPTVSFQTIVSKLIVYDPSMYASFVSTIFWAALGLWPRIWVLIPTPLEGAKHLTTFFFRKSNPLKSSTHGSGPCSVLKKMIIVTVLTYHHIVLWLLPLNQRITTVICVCVSAYKYICRYMHTIWFHKNMVFRPGSVTTTYVMLSWEQCSIWLKKRVVLSIKYGALWNKTFHSGTIDRVLASLRVETSKQLQDLYGKSAIGMKHFIEEGVIFISWELAFSEIHVFCQPGFMLIINASIFGLRKIKSTYFMLQFQNSSEGFSVFGLLDWHLAKLQNVGPALCQVWHATMSEQAQVPLW